MSETGTFSAAVDAVITKSGRLYRVTDIVSAVRRAILDCQTIEFFENDFEEERLTGNVDPYIWRFPRHFRSLKTARYTGIRTDRGHLVYAKKILPSARLEREDYYWYQSGNAVVFHGHGPGNHIDVGYYRMLPPLVYYKEENIRPAIWDDETMEWRYTGGMPETDEERLAKQDLVTNWLLFNFFEIIVDGALNYIFNIIEDPRARQSYAIYQAGRQMIQRAFGEGGA